MILIVDGDAFPNLLKPILYKAIVNRALQTIVVSNKKIDIGSSKLIEYRVVTQGFNRADDHIVEITQSGDFVVTADIPLAKRVIDKDGHALDHRGTLYTKENIGEYFAMRNLMEEIRDSGEKTKGPAPFTKKDVGAFANGLYKFLDSYYKSSLPK